MIVVLVFRQRMMTLGTTTGVILDVYLDVMNEREAYSKSSHMSGDDAQS